MKIGPGDVAVAVVTVIGIGAVLVRVSQLNNGALIAPVVAGILCVGLYGAGRTFPDGRIRSWLILTARGVLVLGLLFLGLLVVLLIALSKRGD